MIPLKDVQLREPHTLYLAAYNRAASRGEFNDVLNKRQGLQRVGVHDFVMLQFVNRGRETSRTCSS